MFTEEMLQAIAIYEANLHLDGQGDVAPAPGGTAAPPRADHDHRRHHDDHHAATTTTTKGA